MRIIRVSAVAAAATAVLTLAACGGGSSTGGSSGGNTSSATITYWASNQGASLQADYNVLNPELAKFKKATGITVKLQVIGWADLLNRILAATTSGQGPDVVNIGNTWSASLQATGAFLPFNSSTFSQVGGESKFLTSAVGSTGAAGKPPAAVPLYSLAYAMYYNKAMFHGGRHRQPAHDLERAGRRRQEAHPRQPVRPRRRGREHPGEHPQRVHPVQADGGQLLRLGR